MDLVPVRAPHVTIVEDGEEITLSVTRRDSRTVRALSLFFTLPPTRSFRLDRIGALVWRLCDGTIPVAGISRRVGEEFGWPQEQARESVLRFLSILSERRLVGFPDAGDRERSGGTAGTETA